MSTTQRRKIRVRRTNSTKRRMLREQRGIENRDRILDAQAQKAEDKQWREDAYRFLVSYCKSHKTMFPDDLWDAGMPEPPGPKGSRRKVGVIIARASKAGIIEPTGMRPSPSSNMSMKPVWKSNIYKAGKR